MTEEEIIEEAKKADALMKEYCKIAGRISRELAVMKSRFVDGSDNSYNGELGCHETGPNNLCLHRAEGWLGRHDSKLDRAYDFQFAWQKKFTEAGVTSVYVSGHY